MSKDIRIKKGLNINLVGKAETVTVKAPDSNVYVISIDNNNIKWIGSNGGLTRFDDLNWQTYDMQNSGLPLNLVRTIDIDNNNLLWIGMAGQGIVQFNYTLNDWSHYNAGNSNLPNNFVNRICHGFDSKKWIATENGIAVH